MSQPPFDVKFLHIGHHKAGSTFIQREVIAKMPGLRDLPGKGPDGLTNEKLRRGWINMIQCADLFFELDDVVEAFAEVDFNCISNEGFVGFGSLEASHGNHVEHTARRLRALFGETKILFVIRNQRDVIRSYYLDDVEFGYAPTFEKWFSRRCFHRQFDWFKYAPTIALYQNVFGAANVKVVPFDDLFCRETFEEIFEVFGVDCGGLETVDFSKRVNEGMSAPVLAASRVINRLIGTRANWGDGYLYRRWIKTVRPLLEGLARALGAGKPGMDFPGFDEAVDEMFGEDNRRASALIGVDLAARGYPIANRAVDR